MSRRDGSDPLDHLDPVAAEATRWFVLLHEEPSDTSRQMAFVAWRDADPAHAAAYVRLQRLWGASGHLASLQHEPRGTDRRSVLRTTAKMSMLLAVGAGAGRLALGPHPLADYATAIGERRTVALSDGSSVELSTRTALSIEFDVHRRYVRLLDGEAWFHVAKDRRGRPFVVEAAGGTTTALGTAFSVAHDDLGAIVSVTEHATRVDAAGASQRIEAGQSCRYGRGRLQPAGPMDPARLAWRAGRLVFVSLSLAEVVAAVDRWRLGRTVILDAALAKHPVTLMIGTDEVDQALFRLAASLPMRITQVTPLLTLVRAGL